MANYGLFGHPLRNTFSKLYFLQKCKQYGLPHTYVNYDLPDLSKVAQCIQTAQLSGFNITIPYKQNIIPFLTGLDAVSAAVGAVNTVRIQDGNLFGYNTDVFGFKHSLLPLLQPHHTAALVFGNGGAAKAVCYVLEELQIPFKVISRKGPVTYADLNQDTLDSHPLLINCTPVGMHTSPEETLPIPFHWIGERHLAYDLIYDPATTSFLAHCAAQGAATKNGLEMLHLQADRSFEIWMA